MKLEGQSFRRAMLWFGENCLPLSHFLEHLVPVGGALWRGYRTLRRWILAGIIITLDLGEL